MAAVGVDRELVVAAMRGEGYLYRYEARRKKWLDYRSMSDIDVQSLTYDAQRKLYVARADQGAVLLISNQGELLGSKPQHANLSVRRAPDTPGPGPPATPVNERQLPVLQ